MSQDPAFPTNMGNTPAGLTKREWLVGQLVAGPLFTLSGGIIPPMKDIWELADKILKYGKNHPPET